MNYLKKALERRLRAKIALKAHYSISDAQAVYEFVKNGTIAKHANHDTIKGGRVFKGEALKGVNLHDGLVVTESKIIFNESDSSGVE